MKKLSLKSKILLGTILMGGTFAGAHAVVNTPDAQESTYNWKAEDNAPQNPGGTLNNQTVSQAIQHFGCEGEGNLCATGERQTGTGATIVELEFN